MRIAYLGDPNNLHTRRWVSFFVNRGHACAVFCDPPVLRPFEGVEIICPQMSLLRKAIAFKLIHHPYSNNFFKAGPYRAAVAHWRPDLVHGFEALAFGYATAACRRRPTVLTPWGNDLFDWPQRSKVARFLVARAMKGAWAISTNAPGLETYLEREYGVPREKVDCFSWGVDLRTFHPGLEEEAAAFGKRHEIPAGARVILSPRMMKPYWGVGLIAEALRAIVERLGARTVVVFLRGFGSADYERELRRLVENRGLAAHARFIEERLAPSEMAAAFNRAGVFLSIPETDLLAATVLEGMACGCAPILADLPFYHQRVEDGRNGFYLQRRSADGVADAVTRAFENPERLKDMARFNTALIAEKDDWLTCAKRMEALYERLVKR
ncbi:MAG: glycosyltransferase family 4 protein [Candidatus Sumerlaeota bacterium]|nr:glycosyltransferase family 4 protein [Candidatus Sumerlaeota bacterium]